MYVLVCVCVCVCACMRVREYVYVCMYLYICVCTCVCLYELISCTRVSTDDRQQPALLSLADTGYDLVRGYNLH